jgi:hypothetical protein
MAGPAAGGHDGAVLVHVRTAFADSAGRPWVALRTALGSAAVRWGGPPPATGPHRVEWTVDDTAPGARFHPARRPGPRIAARGRTLAMRGRLVRDGGGPPHLLLGSTAVLLDPAAPLGELADGAWTELVLPAADAAVYPYTV